MKLILRGFGVAAILALAPQPASADLFGNDGPLCSVLSIGCPPPPSPPAPVVEPVAAPEKPVQHVRKAKPKPKKAKAEKAEETPAATEAPAAK